MPIQEILNLPLELQVALGGGYLAYATAYAGLRRGHSGSDSAMIALAFGLIGVGVFRLVGLAPGYWRFAQIPAAVLVMQCAGLLWRAWGRVTWRRLLRWFRVHQDDGLTSAWDALIQSPGLKITQVRVITKDGRDLWCSNASLYSGPAEMTLGVDGAVTMVVESEESYPASTGEEPREEITDPWGTRVTYIPADQIARVELRCR